MIVVERSAPLLTVQDHGRFGYLSAGVTRSGPLDALALEVANAIVGNAGDAAALEGCQGGAVLRFERETTIAITGADVSATLNATPIQSYTALTARAGDALTIERIVRGAIWYVAVRGGIDVPIVLGSRATLLSAGLGGVAGGPIKAGTRLSVCADSGRARPLVAVPDELRSRLDEVPIPLCSGPRTDALDTAEWEVFYRGTFTVSHSVSRVGYRLQGPVLPSRLPADLPSEPACAGAMQLPPEGLPIVLMADFPTIGGYPMIGVVPAHALGWLAQRAPGASVRFAIMSISDAISATLQVRDVLSKWLSRG
jgi:biotin-dependent carboxylase-like uncharacterized protein